MAKTVSVWKAGLKCRCPRCGEGHLFETFLGFGNQCSECGLDFSSADAGDGPAFFVMFLVAILVTPPVLIVQILFDPPAWGQALIWSPVVIVLSAYLLRPFKGLLFALQWENKAEEARWDFTETKE